MMNPSCVRSAPTGVENCLPDFLPVCRMAAAYEFFRPANEPMAGLSKYLFEIRTARSSGRGQVPGASATSPTILVGRAGTCSAGRRPRRAGKAMILTVSDLAAETPQMCFTHQVTSFDETFWGWRDHQLPDGTIIWTAPGPQTHTTHPGSRLLFPTLCKPTAPVSTPAGTAVGPNRNLMIAPQ